MKMYKVRVRSEVYKNGDWYTKEKILWHEDDIFKLREVEYCDSNEDYTEEYTKTYENRKELENDLTLCYEMNIDTEFIESVYSYLMSLKEVK